MHIFIVVVKTVSTKYKQIYHMSPLGGNKVAVCGMEHDGMGISKIRLLLYNLQNSKELSRVTLHKRPDGMTEITMDGRQCLALSYK